MTNLWPYVAGGIFFVVVGLALVADFLTGRKFTAGKKLDIDHNEALKNVVSAWKPTGYIDYSVPAAMRVNPKSLTEPGFFPLMVEEHRIVKSVGGGQLVERRMRRANLAEAREHASNYYQFLQEHPEKAFTEDPRKSAGQPREAIGQ